MTSSTYGVQPLADYTSPPPASAYRVWSLDELTALAAEFAEQANDLDQGVLVTAIERARERATVLVAQDEDGYYFGLILQGDPALHLHNCSAGAYSFDELMSSISSGRHDFDEDSPDWKQFLSAHGFDREAWDWGDIRFEVAERSGERTITADAVDAAIHRALR